MPVPPPGSATRQNGTASPARSPQPPAVQSNGLSNGGSRPGQNGHIEDVYTNSEFEQDESLEGTSVDDPESDNDALKQAGRLIVFKKAEEVVAHVALNIRESRALCVNGDLAGRNEERFSRAKDLLTTESRQFVTASKLFVKSATESEGQLMECLNHCVHMIDRIGE